MRVTHAIFISLLLSGCASAGGPYPSLQPRTAEAIDPRLSPLRPTNDRPATAGLAARLGALVDQAHAGDKAFEPSAIQAERLAATAGARQSESWITAQEALSAAIAAGQMTSTALADIDALEAAALQQNGGIAPNDLKAIDAASAEVATIANAQAQRLSKIKQRLSP
jgi:hypothetical protein